MEKGEGWNMTEQLDEIAQQVKTGLTEALSKGKFKRGDLFVVGLSTSEVEGQEIGKDPNIEIGRVIIKNIISVLRPLGIHLAVQGCQHLNRALVVERSVAQQLGLEEVTVFPQLHAGGAGQIAAFENFEDPIEVEHVQAKGGMDIGDTAIGMQVKFVQIPIRTSVSEIGHAHTTYLSSRPKLIGGPMAKYTWDPFDQKK